MVSGVCKEGKGWMESLALQAVQEAVQELPSLLRRTCTSFQAELLSSPRIG